MFKNESLSISSSGVGERLIQFDNNASTPPSASVTNKDNALGVAIEYQESDDGNTWTTISGTARSINPGNSDTQIVQSTMRYLTLFVTGAVTIEFQLNRVFNSTGTTIDLR